MLRIDSFAQPQDGMILGQLRTAAADPIFGDLDAAVAYITTGGVNALRAGAEGDFDRLQTRWLSSFDWCRSVPLALQGLDQQVRSEVRIFEGDFVVDQAGCRPRRSFHPKGFLFSGPTAMLLISGSGNLSRNGLTHGVELDTIIEVRNPITAAEKSAWAAIRNVKVWFDQAWKGADAYTTLHGRYRSMWATVPISPPTTDDDITNATLTQRGYDAIDLIRIRRANVFWIEAGRLTENLGRGVPGNQLMMRALTRAFFGFPATEIIRKSAIGTIDMVYQGQAILGLTLQFAHNGMDRLNLPRPGDGGPPKYDGETLIIEKIAQGGQFRYALRLASVAERRRLRRVSETEGTVFKMPMQGRQFGFCQL